MFHDEIKYLDINWNKTFIMFITNRREITLPTEIDCNNATIKVVSSFKLLGVTIDRNLNFLEHVHEVRKAVNKRLYSIQRLFFYFINEC